jgi:hypothetical protein
VALGTEPYPVRVRRSSSRLPNDAQKPLEVLERERERVRGLGLKSYVRKVLPARHTTQILEGDASRDRQGTTVR